MTRKFVKRSIFLKSKINKWDLMKLKIDRLLLSLLCRVLLSADLLVF